MKVEKAILKELDLWDKIPAAFTIKIKLAEHCTGLFTHGRITVASLAGSKRQIQVNDEERMKRRLKNLAGVDDCHIVACAHGHHLIHAPRLVDEHIVGIDELTAVEHVPFIGPNGEVHWDDTDYLMTGSFLKSVIAQKWAPGVEDRLTYSEAGSYGATQIGYMRVNVRDHRVAKIEKVRLS